MEVQESRFAAEHIRRKHYDVEVVIRDFEQRAEMLMREIIAQEQIARNDPKRLAYASYATHALMRHNNLLRSIQRLKQPVIPKNRPPSAAEQGNVRQEAENDPERSNRGFRCRGRASACAAPTSRGKMCATWIFGQARGGRPDICVDTRTGISYHPDKLG
jgi:hypothetical protein